MNQWKQVWEIPKDGSTVLAFIPGSAGSDFTIVCVEWSVKHKRWHAPSEGWNYDEDQIMAWMPLPTPPEDFAHHVAMLAKRKRERDEAEKAKELAELARLKAKYEAAS